MRRAWRWCVGLLVSGVAAALAGDAAEPTYQGRAVKEWVADLRLARPAARRDAAHALGQIGPAAARMTSAAAASRSKVSHHGVRDGVSSFGRMSNNSRVGGNSIRRGRGGMTRSSHHNTGRLNRPSSSSGWAKVRGRPAIMRFAPL